MLPLVSPVVAALALLVVPIPAHATVVDTNPAEGEVVTEPLESFSITVNEDILDVGGVDTANVISITDAEGMHYGDGCSSVDGEELSAAVVLGEPGDYTMSFALVSADGHTIEGSVPFEWAPEGDVETAEGTESAPACGEQAGQDESAAPSESDGASDESATPSSDAPTDEASDAQPAWLMILGYIGLAVVACLVIGTVIGVVRRRR